MIYRINEFFNNKNVYIVFLLLLCACLISLFSAKSSLDIFYCIDSWLKNNMSNMILCLIVFYSVILYLKYMKNYMFIIRKNKYSDYIKTNIIHICVINFIIITTYLILGVAVHIPFSYLNFESPNFYNLPYLIYLLIYLLRYYVFYILSSVIFYLIYEFSNKIMCSIYTCIMLLGYFYYNHLTIYHFYDILYLPSNFMSDIIFDNLFLEILCSLIQFCLMSLTIEIIYNKLIKYRRDMIM